MSLAADFNDIFCHSGIKLHSWIQYFKELRKCDAGIFHPNLEFLDQNIDQLNTLCDEIYQLVIENVQHCENEKVIALACKTGM